MRYMTYVWHCLLSCTASGVKFDVCTSSYFLSDRSKLFCVLTLLCATYVRGLVFASVHVAMRQRRRTGTIHEFADVAGMVSQRIVGKLFSSTFHRIERNVTLAQPPPFFLLKREEGFALRSDVALRYLRAWCSLRLSAGRNRSECRPT